MLVAGAALVLLGLISWALYGVQAGSENRSFHPTGAPPTFVRLSAGEEYWLAVPDGVQRLREVGIEPSKLTCTAASPGAEPGPLEVDPVVHQPGEETKFLNRVASLVAQRSGRFHVECDGVGPVFVENPVGTGFDWSGFWLILASSALVVGIPLVLSGLRRTGRWSDHPEPAPVA
jgi:hypothetical protein